jgi:hypothetical protein
MAEHDDGGMIGLDHFEKLDPEIRELVLHLRSDLRAAGLSIEGRTKRMGTIEQTRAKLTEIQPDFYSAMTDEGFEYLMTLADTWVVVEETVREKAAKRAAEHPDGKWSLDDLRTALAAHKPGLYGGMNNGQIAAMCREAGIEVRTIRIGGKTAKGIRQADVQRLMAGREGKQKGVTRP